MHTKEITMGMNEIVERREVQRRISELAADSTRLKMYLADGLTGPTHEIPRAIGAWALICIERSITRRRELLRKM